jgi:hypothetical protein
MGNSSHLQHDRLSPPMNVQIIALTCSEFTVPAVGHKLLMLHVPILCRLRQSARENAIRYSSAFKHMKDQDLVDSARNKVCTRQFMARLPTCSGSVRSRCMRIPCPHTAQHRALLPAMRTTTVYTYMLREGTSSPLRTGDHSWQVPGAVVPRAHQQVSRSARDPTHAGYICQTVTSRLPCVRHTISTQAGKQPGRGCALACCAGTRASRAPMRAARSRTWAHSTP